MEKRTIILAILLTLALTLLPIASYAAMMYGESGAMMRPDSYEAGAVPTQAPGLSVEAVHAPFWSEWTKGDCHFSVEETPEWEQRSMSRPDSYEAAGIPTESGGGPNPNFLAYNCPK